jgi:hypothetical protein
MKICLEYEELISRLVSGENTPEELERLEQHCAGCPVCRDIVSVHEGLESAVRGVPDPGPEALQKMRSSVIRQWLETRNNRRILKKADWFGGFDQLLKAAGIGVLMLASLWIGRWSARPQETTSWVKLLSRERPAATLTDVFENRFVYSNATVERLTDGSMAVGFDLTTRVNLTFSEPSPLAGEVIAQSILNSDIPAVRLRSLQHARHVESPLVRDSMVTVLETDKSFATRLKALTLLADSPQDQEAERAILNSLMSDPSVQIRLAALDLLIENRVAPARIVETLMAERPEANRAVLYHATQAAYLQPYVSEAVSMTFQ